MNTTRSVKSPQNVTIAKNPDNALSTAINNNIRLIDYQTGDEKFKFENLDVLADFKPSHKSYEDRLAKEYELLRQHPANPLVLNRIGSIYLANGRLDKAQTAFKKALQQDTNNLDAIRNLAAVYLAKGKPGKAEGVYGLVIKDKTSPQLLYEASIPKLILGKLDEAIELLERIKSSYRSYHEVMNNMGLIKLIQRNFNDAEQHFREAARINPTYAPAFNNLGVIYQNTQKLQEAEVNYEKAVTLDANYIDAYNNLFQLLVAQDKKEAAKEVIIRAQHLKKIQPELIFKYAWILMHLGKYQNAIKKYYELLEFLPNNGNTLNNIGFCYAELKQYDKALTLYEEASKHVSGHYLPQRNLMNLLTEMGYVERALHIAKQLIKVNSNDPVVQAALASAYVTKDDWENANKYLLSAYEQRPPITYLYNLVGLYYADVEPDFKKGEEALLFPLKNNIPKKEEVYNNLAHLYLINNKLDKAKDVIKHLNPKHPIVLATLALYDLKNNRVKAAIEKYDRAIESTNDGFKTYIKQRKNFDLGSYYILKDDKKKAKEYLSEAIGIKKGYKYVRNHALELIEDL